MRRRKGISEKAQISVRRGGREIQFPLDPSRATTGSMLAGIRALVDNGCSPCTIAAMYTSGPVYTYKYGRGLHAACPLWIPWAYNFHAHTASSLENTTVKMPPSRQQRRIHIPLGMRMDTQYVAWFLLDRESFTSLPRLLYIYIETARSRDFIPRRSRVLLRWISCGGGEEIFFLLVWRMTTIF